MIVKLLSSTDCVVSHLRYDKLTSPCEVGWHLHCHCVSVSDLSLDQDNVGRDGKALDYFHCRVAKALSIWTTVVTASFNTTPRKVRSQKGEHSQVYLFLFVIGKWCRCVHVCIPKPDQSARGAHTLHTCAPAGGLWAQRCRS